MVEAGASGLPVVAVAEGGPASLIENRNNGHALPPRPRPLAGAVLQLAASPLLRAPPRRFGARAPPRGRSWERALEQLAGGYERALAPGAGQAFARAA